MKLNELKSTLEKTPSAQLRFHLPNGDFAPAHIHITEVARVDKRFIDCGGTLRSDSVCRLQTWFSDDVEHRLTAGKLLKIFEKATEVLLTDDLDVDVEHEIGFISQFPLESVEVSPDQIVFRLAEKHTACLAADRCKSSAPPPAFSPMKFNFSQQQPASKCCS